MTHRETGDRFRCGDCGSTILYEAACPCCSDGDHVETCCGKPMSKV